MSIEKSYKKDGRESVFFRPFYTQHPEKYENIAFYDKIGHFALPDGTVLQLKNKPYIEDLPICFNGKGIKNKVF